MLDKATVYRLCLSLFCIDTCATELQLDATTDDGYVLSRTDGTLPPVYLIANGTRSLHISAIYPVECQGKLYYIPRISGEINNGATAGGYHNYVVFRRDQARYTPVKSVMSVHAVDTATNTVISRYLIPADIPPSTAALCDSIVSDRTPGEPLELYTDHQQHLQ